MAINKELLISCVKYNGTDIPIKSGVDTSDATLNSNSQMLSGITAYSNGIKYTGDIPTKTNVDLTVNGATVTVPSGYYASQSSKSVATVTQATPTISVDGAGLVTASSNQNEGYVSSGTKKGTHQLTTQAGETVTVNKTLSTKGKYMTGDIVVNVASTGITPSGTININTNGTHDVTEYAKAEVNVPIPTFNTESKTVNPSLSQQTVTPSDGYDGLSSVVVNAMPTAVQATPSISVSESGLITSSVTQYAGYVSAGTKSSTQQLSTIGEQTYTAGSNELIIAKGSYLTGDQIISPVATETKNITQNGVYTPSLGKYFNSVTVNVPSSEPVLQDKTVTPSETVQNISADYTSGYNGLKTVTVNAIPNNYIGSAVPKKTSTDLTVSGAQITAPAGYYASNASKSVPTGVLSNPTINTSTGVVTASVGTSGYLTSGTNKTLNLTTKGTATITPTESAQTIAANQYLTGVQTISAIPSDYIGSAVKVQNFGTGSTLPDPSEFGEGDLFLIV